MQEGRAGSAGRQALFSVTRSNVLPRKKQCFASEEAMFSAKESNAFPQAERSAFRALPSGGDRGSDSFIRIFVHTWQICLIFDGGNKVNAL